MPTSGLPNIIEQHLDECSSLWAGRRLLASSPSRGLDQLHAHDLRIQAHLDGLRVDPELGWCAAQAAIEEGSPGAVFPATVLAIESGVPDRLDTVLAAALAGPVSVSGFLAGCDWLPYPKVLGTIRGLLAREDAFFVHLGVAISGLHRQDPGPKLNGAVEAGDPLMRARAWRVAGWVRRRDVLGCAWKAYGDESPDVRFAAGFAGPLLGDLNGITILQELAVSDWPRRQEAAVLAMRALEPERARPWHEKIAADPQLSRVAVAAAGAIGDPALVPWLLGCLDRPDLARGASDAFATIAGARIVADGLEGATPEGVETGPNDEPSDENVAMDPDEFLPWPDPAKVRAWWDANGSRFRPGVRHLLGKPVSPESLRYALAHGTQRQRAAAAFEIALADPRQTVFETRAPAFRQMQVLGWSPPG